MSAEPINKEDALKFCDLITMYGAISIKRVRAHEIAGPVPNAEMRRLIAKYLFNMADKLMNED